MAKPQEQTKWVYRSVYEGFQTKRDPEKVQPGAAVSGQNVSFNYKDRISVRQLGYSVYPASGTALITAVPITSNHTFRRRDGTNIQVRSQTTILEYYDETSSAWVTIKGGYTTGKSFGYADYNINTDAASEMYFGNGVENYSRWTGNKTNLTSALNNLDVTVNVADTTGFPATGNITIGGTVVAYSAKAATTFTIGAWAGATIASGTGICESPTEYAGGPKGNIFITYGNRIFVAGITATPQAAYFSKYGDATDWSGATLVTASTATSAGIFNLAEGGGGIVGFSMDEKALYILKKSIVYVVTLSDNLYSLAPLKSFDGKSQTTGAIGTNAVFSSQNGVVFITPDNKIYILTRLPTIDYPQMTPISDIIKPTVDALDFSVAAGISFRDKIYIACSSVLGGKNDTVLVYNIQDNVWDLPVTGWNVADWLIYNSGTGLDQLFFSSNNSPNTFKVTTTPTDGDYDVTASAAMNQDTFGAPAVQKFCTNFFFEGYIAENTTLTGAILFNDNGYTGILNWQLKGTQSAYIFATSNINVFGENSFGVEMFGSNTDASGLRKFRVYTVNSLRVVPFYNLQVSFASAGANQQWRITNYGFKVGIYESEENRNLYKSFGLT